MRTAYSRRDSSRPKVENCGEVRAALDANRLQLHSQLILPFAQAANPHPHYEILLRMLDEQGHTVGPDRFLSATNRYQLMPEIDRWVLDKAIESLKPHAQLLTGGEVCFAINFSGQSLNDEEFIEFLVERVRGSGPDPAVFCFELTENAAINSMARGMSIATVAEYVETDEIRSRIATLGVDYGQGFAIGRPTPLTDLLEELPLLMATYLADNAPTVINTTLPQQYLEAEIVWGGR